MAWLDAQPAPVLASLPIMNRGVGGTLLLLVSCVATGAYGQAPITVAPASEYELLVRDGAAEFGRGNFVEARALFEQAHARRPSARTLRGLGLCAYELKRYRQAIVELEAALKATIKPLTDTQRAEVAQAINKARRFVGTLRLEVRPTDAAISIDGKRIAMRQVDLDVGDHVLAASAPGHKSGEQRVNVMGGRKVTVRMMLMPLESPQAQNQSVVHDRPRDATGVGPWPWAVTAASGALMIGGGVLIALALSDVSTVDDAKKGTPFSALEPAYDGAPIKSGIGFAMLGVGATGVTLGLIWALGASDEKGPIDVVVGSDRVVLKGTF